MDIAKQTFSMKRLITAVVILGLITTASYFGTDYFKGSVSSVPSSSGPDLAIATLDGVSPAIYLDSSNKLYVVHANIGDTKVDDSLKDKGNTYIYIYKNSDLTKPYKKLTYSWSTLKDKNFLNAKSSSILQPTKLDSKDYTVQACIDNQNNVVSNETNESGKFDCATGSSANNFFKVNLAPVSTILPTVTITFDPAYADESKIVSETESVGVGYFKVKITDGDVILEDATFTDNGDDNSSVYSSFELKNTKGDLIGTAAIASGKITFDNLDYIMKADTEETLIVYAKVKEINSLQNTGAKLMLSLEYGDIYFADKTTSLEIPGALLIITGSRDGSINQVKIKAYASIPTISMVALSNSELIEGGDREVFKFNITADDSNDIYLSRVALNISASSTVSLTSPKLYQSTTTNADDYLNETEAGQPYESATQSFSDGIYVNGENIVFDLLTPFKITAGKTVTFVVKTTVIDTAETESSELKLRLLGDTLEVRSSSVDNLDNTYNFIWADGVNAEIGAPSSETANQWANGWEVEKLPTDYQTLSTQY